MQQFNTILFNNQPILISSKIYFTIDDFISLKIIPNISQSETIEMQFTIDNFNQLIKQKQLKHFFKNLHYLHVSIDKSTLSSILSFIIKSWNQYSHI